VTKRWVCKCVAVRCSVLQCVAECCSVLQCVAMTVECAKWCDNAAGMYVSCSVLQCVTACLTLCVAV